MVVLRPLKETHQIKFYDKLQMEYTREDFERQIEKDLNKMVNGLPLGELTRTNDSTYAEAFASYNFSKSSGCLNREKHPEVTEEWENQYFIFHCVIPAVRTNRAVARAFTCRRLSLYSVLMSIQALSESRRSACALIAGPVKKSTTTIEFWTELILGRINFC
jgi:hypothetical protein